MFAKREARIQASRQGIKLLGGRVTYVLFRQLKCILVFFLSFSVGLARQANRLTE